MDGYCITESVIIHSPYRKDRLKWMVITDISCYYLFSKLFIYGEVIVKFSLCYKKLWICLMISCLTFILKIQTHPFLLYENRTLIFLIEEHLLLQ
jgi:hypothetical protein